MSDETKARDKDSDDAAGNFVADIVREDLATGATGGRVVTRFPPEPNGYLHVGHAKSIVLNFGLARDFGGTCNLRFDDTNPETEETEYVDAIKADIRWLGFEWDGEHFASDYFPRLYEWAEKLVMAGKAYVDSRGEEDIRETRGDFHRPGVNSPYRDRSPEENLALLRQMKAGELDEGSCVLRAKIDMASKDLKLRDPLMYRIRKVSHHRTGDTWCIYPMYDWAHGQSDAVEQVTHSVCTLEFINHHALYDWFLEALELTPRPKQIEFAKLSFSHTVLSKRRLLSLVKEGHVRGWDDPRMPTLAGMRRRGFTPESIVALCERVGVAKSDSTVDIGLLEHTLREDLNGRTARTLGVLRPLEVVIENFDEDRVERVTAPFHPEDASQGARELPLTKRLWVERDDFMEEPPKQWYRLAPGKEVRLRYACYVTVTEVVRNDAGEITQLRCTWDPESLGGSTADGRKVRGTIHWVSQRDAVDAEVRLYDRLYTVEDPMDAPEGKTFLDFLNPESLEIISNAKLEPSLADPPIGKQVQLERLGYFIVDPDSKPGAVVWNRTIALRDSWAKIAARG